MVRPVCPVRTSRGGYHCPTHELSKEKRMTGKPWKLIGFNTTMVLVGACSVEWGEAGIGDDEAGMGLAALGTTAEPYRGGTVNSSALLFGEWDWDDRDGSSVCIEMVERAAEMGNETLNFIPNHYFLAHWSGLDGRGPNRLLVSDFCYGDRHAVCQSFDWAAIQRFEDGMRRCFEVAVAHGLNIAVAPHLDDGSPAQEWRNFADFDPFEEINGTSYAEIMVYPLARALSAAMRPSTKVYFALQGEMGLTVFLHASSYLELADEVRRLLVQGRKADDGRVQVGLSLNFSGAAGRVRPSDLEDLNPLRNLFESVDFVGLSAYHGGFPYPRVEQFDTTIDNFASELAAFGIDLAGLTRRGVTVHFSEFGIGGGTRPHGCGELKATNRNDAARWPYWGIGGAYSRDRDPWVGDVKAFRRDYYVAAVRHFAGLGRWHVDKTFLWNIGSWDSQGLHPLSTNAEGSFSDDFIIDLLGEHNRAVMSGEYLLRPGGIPTCTDPDPDGDGWSWKRGAVAPWWCPSRKLPPTRTFSSSRAPRGPTRRADRASFKVEPTPAGFLRA